MELTKKWWFWVTLYILIGLIVYRGYYVLFTHIFSQLGSTYQFNFGAFLAIVFGWPFFLFAQRIIGIF